MTWADDRAAIVEVEMRYGAGIDRRDADFVAACFTHGAVADYGGAGHLEGARHIAETLVERASRSVATTHFIGGSMVEISGDAAQVETYCVAYLLFDEGPAATMRVRGIRYQDQLVRDGKLWRIAYRRHGADWQLDVEGAGQVGEAARTLPWPSVAR